MKDSKKEFNEKDTSKVAGGNFWDNDKDNDPNHSWYERGQEIEVYRTLLHVTTNSHIILDKQYVDGCWKYCIIESMSNKWITASDIERK